MKNRKLSGFTLVELMTTMALLGVLGAVAAPQLLAGIPTVRVNGAAKRVAAELQFARMKAVSSNRIHHVIFDVSASTLTIKEETSPTVLTEIRKVNLATEFPGTVFGYHSVIAPSGSGSITQAVSFGSGSLEAVFLPSGLVRESGVVCLMPSADIGTANNARLRAVQVSLIGQPALLRYKASASPPWEES